MVIKILGDRYKDRLKHERAFQKLNMMRQEKKIVKEFNQKFTNVLMDLDPRLTEEMLIWYYKTAVRWEFAEVLSSVNRSLERSGPQHRMPEVKLNKPQLQCSPHRWDRSQKNQY
jgi:hypothetical protein